MSDTTTPLVAADGTPLKRKLAQSLMRSRARAFGLALPLLAFILVLFVYPIANFLTQAFYDARFATLMPGTTEYSRIGMPLAHLQKRWLLYLLLI